MSGIFLIGSLAAFLTTASFLPQVIKTHKSGHTKDLSLGMLSIFAMGLTLWSVYGFLLGEMPIILANLITLVMVAYLLYMKLRHG